MSQSQTVLSIAGQIAAIDKQLKAIDSHFEPRTEITRITILIASVPTKRTSDDLPLAPHNNTVLNFPMENHLEEKAVPDSLKSWLGIYRSTLVTAKQALETLLESKLSPINS